MSVLSAYCLSLDFVSVIYCVKLSVSSQTFPLWDQQQAELVSTHLKIDVEISIQACFCAPWFISAELWDVPGLFEPPHLLQSCVD